MEIECVDIINPAHLSGINCYYMLKNLVLSGKLLFISHIRQSSSARSFNWLQIVTVSFPSSFRRCLSLFPFFLLVII